ncbi:MAG: type II secretion system ATPase GspE [Sedimentisphaerales bacterium]|nr:type II secretion system ATPase GspE [Sedimentisphaerales bacterium]
MKADLIGQILLAQKMLEEQQLSEALSLQADNVKQHRIGHILTDLNYVTDIEVLKAISKQWDIPYLKKIPQDKIDKELVVNLPIEFLKKHKILPLRDNDGTIIIACVEPFDTTAFDAIVNILGQTCRRVICSSSAIEDGLSRYFYENEGAPSQTLTDPDNNSELASLSLESGTEDLLDLANRAPVVKLVNTFFFQAVQSRASDIHIEPFEQQVKVRFRIDGVLHNRFTLSKKHVAALVSRLKVMANLNIAERRLPQDGRCRIKIGEKEIDVRVSTVPNSGGERVVLRLLDKTSASFGLDQLGFDTETERHFRKLIRKPYGIILLTGPTGSGKTTTLYGALSELNTEDRNIMTVEDPIEYRLHGVGQMQIQPKIGLTFANSLRHILRQDPDIIMVGEIRDLETARIAIQSALTGHLVLSTLHTNDSASAVTRLIDMGIEPYLVCSSVIGIMAQRLVRAICPDCKKSYEPGEEELLVLKNGKIKSGKNTLYRGSGCVHCIDTGYRGRTGIFELMVIDDRLRELVMANAGSNKIKQAAIKNNMNTLFEDGINKVFTGQTTLEEVLRVTQDDVV